MGQISRYYVFVNLPVQTAVYINYIASSLFNNESKSFHALSRWNSKNIQLIYVEPNEICGIRYWTIKYRSLTLHVQRFFFYIWKTRRFDETSNNVLINDSGLRNFIKLCQSRLTNSREQLADISSDVRNKIT